MCALPVGLHAGQYGRAAKPREDLRRALTVADESIWRAAAGLADRGGAVGPFAMGVRLFPEGQMLAVGLDLPTAASVDDDLRAAGDIKVASGFQRLARALTRRARPTMLIDELWPADFMRWQHSLARRRRGMIAARIGRLRG